MVKIVPNITVSVTGFPKVGKTYFSFTFPSPIKVFSFDIGTRRVLTSGAFKDKQIDIVEFSLPIIESGDERGWAIPLWDKFQKEYDITISEGKYKTITIDPATVVWMINHHAELEESSKRKLGAPAYYRPNLRFGALFAKAATGGINLVTIQHLKAEYINVADTEGREQSRKTGSYVIDGWNRTENTADINIEMELVGKGEKTKTQATIKDCGFDRSLRGSTFIDLTYDKLMGVLGYGTKST